MSWIVSNQWETKLCRLKHKTETLISLNTQQVIAQIEAGRLGKQAENDKRLKKHFHFFVQSSAHLNAWVEEA